MSESKKGKNMGHPSYINVSGIEKMRASKKGKMASDETKQRMSQAQKTAWLRRKAQGTVQL